MVTTRLSILQYNALKSVMFSVLSSSLLTSADKDQKGKYSVPILDVKSRQLVLDTNQTLLLSCR